MFFFVSLHKILLSMQYSWVSSKMTGRLTENSYRSISVLAAIFPKVLFFVNRQIRVMWNSLYKDMKIRWVSLLTRQQRMSARFCHRRKNCVE